MMDMNNLMFIGNLGMGEWVIIFLVVVLLFGGKKIPELARGLGKGIREFKDASKEIKDEVKKGMGDDSDSVSKS
jgi:sec-independent protein translocase protein TatA